MTSDVFGVFLTCLPYSDTLLHKPSLESGMNVHSGLLRLLFLKKNIYKKVRNDRNALIDVEMN